MPGEPGRAAPAEGMTPGAGKIRLVLDYVPCDACLEEPAATWEEQELYCSVCRRLDRTVGYKATVRRFVNVPSPEVPEEVTVEPGPVPAAAPVAGSPLAVEFVLQEASEDGKPPLPPPEADVQVVLEPLLVEPRAPEPEPDVAMADEDDADEWVMDDPFGFTPVETSPPEARAASAAVEAKSGAEASYTLDPWEGEDEGDVVAEPEAEEDVAWPEHDAEDEASPEPEAWPDQEDEEEEEEEEAPQKEPEVEEYPWPDDEQDEEAWDEAEEPEAEAPPEPEPPAAEADDDVWAEDVDDVEEVDVEDVEEVDVEDVDEDTGEERR